MRMIIICALHLGIPVFTMTDLEDLLNGTRTASQDMFTFEISGATGTPRGGAVYSENFETFDIGPLGTQGGWLHYPFLVEVVEPGIQGKSVRHISDGQGLTGTDLFSPVFQRGFHRFTQDVTITGGIDGSTYVISPADLEIGLLITRVFFQPDGDILVLEPTPSRGSNQLVDTGVDWVSGVNLRLQIATNPDGVLKISIDNTLVYTGFDVPFLLTGTPGQTTYCEYLSDNIGTGAFDGSGATLTIDNLTTDPITVPILGTWGMVFLVLSSIASGIYMLRARHSV